MNSVPRFALTEQALKLLLHAEHSVASEDAGFGETSIRPYYGRMSVALRNETWQRETALLRLVAIVESHLDVISIWRISELARGANPTLDKSLHEFELESTSTWENRQAAYLEHHGLRLTSCPGWSELVASREVRNSIAHGMGRMTPKQRKKKAFAKQIEAAGASVSAGQVQLSAHSVPKIASAFRQFVWAVDERI